ncbi:GH24203 [Drosophila grimshawi]|uniref:GH24203 n=1 Tax=Drosophila grimshawi TaxID=7222 RepID=B4JN50_DROGR|nr:GH24203 [Drosophila grimshawi]
MQQVASLKQNLWELLYCLLLQFFGTVCCTTKQTKMQPETGNKQHQQHRQQVHRPLAQRHATAYDKVELLHRMLVAQQLQQLEQRRLLRLALERREATPVPV